MTDRPGPRRTGESRGLRVLRSFGTLGLLLIGLGLVAGPGRAARGPYALVFGIQALGVGGVSLVALVAEARWRRGRPFASLGRTADGQPATLVPRPPRAASMTAWTLAWFTVPLLVAGGLAVVQQQWFWAAVLLGVGLWLARYALPLVMRRPDPGGVTLSRDGITNAREEAWWHVAWDDVVGVVPGAVTGVVLSPGAQVQRQASRLFGARKLGVAPPGVLAIDTRLLTASPEQLATLVRLCVLRPERRAELGAPASLAWRDEDSR